MIQSLHAYTSDFYTKYDLLLAGHIPSRERYDMVHVKEPLPSRKRGEFVEGRAFSPVDHLEQPVKKKARIASPSPSASPFATAAPNTKAKGQTSDVPYDRDYWLKKMQSMRRDMHRALDGTAMVALSILVENHIKRELQRVGYKK